MAQLQFTLEDLQELVKVEKQEAIDTLTMLGFPTELTPEGLLNVEVTPNRPDALCVEGVARALRCFKSGKPALYSAKKSPVSVAVDKSVAAVRPCFGGAVVRNIKMSDSLIRSLMQVQEKLHETLGRKRRKVAIGIHDIGRVKPPFRYFACGRKEISFVPLEMKREMTPDEILQKHPKGTAYAHLVREKCPMITDADGKVLSFPPIINGELTKVTGDAKDLFIDATGTSDAAVRQAVNILAAMLSDRGGKLEEISINGKRYPILEEKEWALPVKEAEKLLGVALGKKKVAAYLSKLGHRVSGNSCFVQGYRADVMHNVDLIEDVAIAHGYNNFEPTIPAAATVGHAEPEGEFHDALVGLGYDEVMTWTLSNPEHSKKALLLDARAVEIENPLTEDFTIFRTAILPNLLSVLADGKNEKLPIKIYEVGTVGIPALETRLSIASMHPKASFSEIKGVILSIAESTGMKIEIRRGEFGPFVKGRCAEIFIGGKKAGFMGEIAPRALSNFKLEQPVCAAEMTL